MSDINKLAFSLVQKATGTKVKNSAAVSLGRLGGLKGGPARAAKLTTERKREIALKAAAKRWSK